MRAFLQQVACCGWNRLRAGWWGYHMLIVLVGGGDRKDSGKLYGYFRKATEK